MRTRRELVSDVREGVWWGLRFATGFSVLAAVILLLGGGRSIPEAAIPYWTIPIIYFVSGLLSGVVWGIGRPLSRTLIGAAVLGYVVAVPAATVIMGIVVPPRNWNSLPAFVAVFAGMYGPICGVWFRKKG